MIFILVGKWNNPYYLEFEVAKLMLRIAMLEALVKKAQKDKIITEIALENKDLKKGGKIIEKIN